MRSLRDATVVIAGASSGVGSAAALTFARHGARLALAARRTALLDVLVQDCQALGARAIAMPTDVTSIEAVRHLAETATGQLGPIQVWINNAGVGAVGRYTETPMPAHRQVIETNLVGAMNGAHAVLPYFMAQRRGVLINTISLGAWVPAPFAAAYAASKYGLLGFSESLSAELADWPHIHVCDVFPSFLDTPGIQHGANYTGRVLKPAPPVYDPQRVADAMLSLARHPRRSVTIGAPARLAKLAHALTPRLTGWAANLFLQSYLRQAPPAPRSDGNLFEPMPHGSTVHGGWERQNRTLATAAAIAGVTTAAIVLPALLSPDRGR